MHFKSIPNTRLLKLSHCFGSREGLQFYPHTHQKRKMKRPTSSPPTHTPILCPVVTSDKLQHWNYSLFLLWTDCCSFRCKLDCVTSCICWCTDRFYTFFPFTKINLKMRCLSSFHCASVCPSAVPTRWQRCLLAAWGFSIAILAAAAWRISSNPLPPTEA